MDNKLKSYGQYSKSEVNYINNYPSHWKITKLRFVFEERKEKNTARKETNILSVMKNKGVIPYSEKGNIGNKHSEDIERYKLVYEDDIVMNSMNVIIGSVGRSKYNGTLSPVYYVLRNRNILNYNTKYFENIFKMTSIQRELTKYGKGILAHRMRIPFEQLKNIDLPLPPKNEQDQIVKYLDWKLLKINKFIKAKIKQIELLKEQKQAIINQAVLKGLNLNVSLKDSGVKLFEKIPTNWELLRFGQCIKKIEQGWSPTASEGALVDDQWAVLSLSSISKGTFRPEAIKPIDINSNVPNALEVVEGDLLLTRSNTRELVGDTCIVRKPRPKTIICDLIYRIKLYENLALPEYISYYLLSSYGRQQIEKDARGSSGTMPKISHKHIHSWIIPLPPVSEQMVLIEYIDSKIEPLVKAIETIKLSVEVMTEYRDSLISNIVTGKVDVRDIVVEGYTDKDVELEEINESEEEILGVEELDIVEV